VSYKAPTTKPITPTVMPTIIIRITVSVRYFWKSSDNVVNLRDKLVDKRLEFWSSACKVVNDSSKLACKLCALCSCSSCSPKSASKRSNFALTFSKRSFKLTKSVV